jgi:hypothetical protein
MLLSAIIRPPLSTSSAAYDVAAVPAPPPPRGASFCLPRNISGVSATVNGTYYVLYPAGGTYSVAVTACNTARGRLAYWLDFETQYAVEQVGRLKGRRLSSRACLRAADTAAALPRLLPKVFLHARPARQRTPRPAARAQRMRCTACGAAPPPPPLLQGAGARPPARPRTCHRPQVLFNGSAGSAVQEYWLGGTSMLMDTRGLFRWTYWNGLTYGGRFIQNGDWWDAASLPLSPNPQDAGPYSHWGDGEPSIWGLWTAGGGWTGNADGSYINSGTSNQNNICMAAVGPLAYSTVGENNTRVANATRGNAWGWARAVCGDTKPYICIQQGGRRARGGGGQGAGPAARPRQARGPCRSQQPARTCCAAPEPAPQRRQPTDTTAAARSAHLPAQFAAAALAAAHAAAHAPAHAGRRAGALRVQRHQRDLRVQRRLCHQGHRRGQLHSKGGLPGDVHLGGAAGGRSRGGVGWGGGAVAAPPCTAAASPCCVGPSPRRPAAAAAAAAAAGAAGPQYSSAVRARCSSAAPCRCHRPTPRR